MPLVPLVLSCFFSVLVDGTDSIKAPACPACAGSVGTMCSTTASVPTSAHEQLLEGLISTLNNTTSVDTFRLSMQLLASMKGSKKAIPAILACAERLGISQGMGEDRSKWTREQQALAAVLRPKVETLRIWLKHIVPTAKVEVVPTANQVYVLTGCVAKEKELEVVLSIAQSVVGDKIMNALRVEDNPQVRGEGIPQVQLDVVIAHICSKDLPLVSAIIDTGEGLAASSPSTHLAGCVVDQQHLLRLLQALRDQGRAKLLAEPRLLTLSGRPASFPFENIGTQVNFLPILRDNGNISLDVECIEYTVDLSEAIPLHTTVEIGSGQTLILAGAIRKTPNACNRLAQETSLILVTPRRIDPAGVIPTELQ